MENLINKIDSYLSSILPAWFNIIKYPDELTGRWSVLMEDGFHMVMGAAIEFKKDGTGILYSWSALESRRTKETFLWKRTRKNTIKVRPTNADEWETERYNITLFINPYNTKYRQLSGLSRTVTPLYMALR